MPKKLTSRHRSFFLTSSSPTAAAALGITLVVLAASAASAAAPSKKSNDVVAELMHLGDVWGEEQEGSNQMRYPSAAVSASSRLLAPFGYEGEEGELEEDLLDEADLTPQEEGQMLDGVIDLLSEELLPPSGHRSMNKRFTVEFNGMQVSYPTYVRLNRLQNKVVKLRKMIELLHQRFSQAQLVNHPQYQRLMTLYESLKPLLPSNAGNFAAMGPLPAPLGADEVEAGYMQHLAEQEEEDSAEMRKRAPLNMQFMGMSVSYPQYLRLKALQDKVIRLDLIIRRMAATVPPERLEQMPKWHRLVALHEALSKMLPEGHMDSLSDSDGTSGNVVFDDEMESDPARMRSKRSAGTAEFNGKIVSMPEYFRLLHLQKSALKLDTVMRKMRATVGDSKLRQMPKWGKMLKLRKALESVLPMDKDLNEIDGERSKRVLTMDFNGVRVTYPQYLHLKALQKKVLKLDSVMGAIAAAKTPEQLANNPKWHKLQSLRRSLVKLLPKGEVNTDEELMMEEE